MEGEGFAQADIPARNWLLDPQPVVDVGRAVLEHLEYP
jgi:hypothetical protein